MLDTESCEDDFVYVWGEGTLDELQQIIDEYRKLGFNKVWPGYENSTLCMQKMREEE